MNLNPSIVFTLGIGTRAIKLFKEKNIKLKTGKYQKISEVIENIGNLDNIKGGCEH